MKYLLAPDSFKEAASAQAVAEAMRRGVLAGDPDAECRMMPLSDGGEGLTTALVRATGGELKPAHAHDALGRPICAQYGFLGGGSHMETNGKTGIRTAVVELAAASGIEHVSPADRDPLAASTYGNYVTTIDGKMNYLEAVKDIGYVYGEAEVQRQGGRIGVYLSLIHI